MNHQSFRLATQFLPVLLAIAGACFPNWVLAQPSTSAKKYALLVAVNRYEDDFLNHPELRYPESEAAALEDVLSSSGYVIEVLVGKQANQSATQVI